MFSYFVNKFGISTHTLTWSVTNYSFKRGVIVDISTHTLTWSVTIHYGTVEHKMTDFNSHAHVERDYHTVIHHFRHSVYFNSHAHVERDVSVSL